MFHYQALALPLHSSRTAVGGTAPPAPLMLPSVLISRALSYIALVLAGISRALSYVALALAE